LFNKTHFKASVSFYLKVVFDENDKFTSSKIQLDSYMKMMNRRGHRSRR